MSKPMPSPRGTNIEGLYLGDRRGAAYDAAMLSAEGNLSADQLDAVLEFLADKLGPDELAVVKQLLMIEGGGTDVTGMDEPPPFPGRPTPGGKLVGMDGRLHDISHLSPRIRAEVRRAIERQRADNAAGFSRRHPDAARIKTDRYPRPER